MLSKEELCKDTEHMVRAFLMTTEMIQDAPTVDATPVVRCKDCIYYDSYELCKWRQDEQPDEDDFCSVGERKSE